MQVSKHFWLQNLMVSGSCTSIRSIYCLQLLLINQSSSKINYHFVLQVVVLLSELALVEETTRHGLARKFFSHKLSASKNSLSKLLVLDEYQAQPFDSLGRLFQVDNLVRSRDDNIHDFAKSFSHFSDVLENLLIFLVDGQLFNGHNVFQYDYFTGRAYYPLLNRWNIGRSQSCNFLEDGFHIAIGSHLGQQSFVVLDVLLGTAQLELVPEERSPIQSQSVCSLLCGPELDEGIVTDPIWTDPSAHNGVTLLLSVDLHFFEGSVEHVHELL